MATPVIESVSTAVADATNAITVTKPSGTVDGDLLLAMVFTYEGTGGSTPSLESGWTNVGTGLFSFNAYRVMYRVASSEGANYTFDVPTTVDSIRCVLFRISGYNSADIFRIGQGTLATLTTTPSVTVSLTPRATDSLLIMGFLSDASTTGTTTSGYTKSGTNPTWTEHYDNTEGAEHIFAVASATNNSLSTITSVGLTYSQTAGDHLAFLLELPEQKNASGTNTFTVTEPSVFNTTGSAGTNGTVALGLSEPYVPATSGEGITPTSWDTVNKS